MGFKKLIEILPQEFLIMIYRFIALLLVYTLSIHSINAPVIQEKDVIAQNQDNLILSIQQKMRKPEYPQEILPNDFSHFSRLLKFGVENHQSPLFLRSVTKSFTNILKRSRYVNAHAFSQLLEEMPKYILPYFTLPSSQAYISNAALYDAAFIDRFKSTVNNMLYSKFSTEYETFRQDPASFLQTISGTIVTMAQEELMQEQVRQGIIRFCELALSKLIWDPIEQEKTWFTTKKIAEQIAQLLEYNILDDTNDVEDLHLTLLNRYCYFIEITATDMAPSFYAAIKNDLASNNIVLFALAEQDNFLESKLSYMQRTLIEAETALYRYQSGLLKM